MFRYYLHPTNIIYTHNYTNLYTNIAHAFEINTMGAFNCDRTYYTMRDNLNCCLMIYTLEGEGYMEYENSRITLPPNSLVVINCNRYQLYKTHKEHWKFLWFHFYGPNAFDLVDEINDEGLFRAQMDQTQFIPEFQNLLDLIKTEERNTPLEISLVIHRLLCGIMKLKLSDTQKTDSRILSPVFTHIEQNYPHKITVDELAQKANLSKFYFIKVFRKATGTTPYKYILNVRISKAKELLLSTDLPLSSIAETCGFYDSKNFILHFKNAVHCTPDHFRKHSFRSL